MKAKSLIILPVVLLSLVSCNKEVSKNEFSEEVSKKQESAKTTEYKKLEFKGNYTVTSGSTKTEGNLDSTIYNVSWSDKGVPSLKAEGNVSISNSAIVLSISGYFVLNSTIIAAQNTDTTKFYTGSDFKIEESVESTDSDGNKSTSKGTMVWNSDLLLTSIKGDFNSIGSTMNVDLTLNWSK